MSGLVESERRGREVMYRLTTPEVGDLIDQAARPTRLFTRSRLAAPGDAPAGHLRRCTARAPDCNYNEFQQQLVSRRLKECRTMGTVSSAIPKLGTRSTRQRSAIVSVLLELDNFASAKKIHSELKERGEKVGLTTVYRTLQSLTEIHAVDALHMASGETLYRHCMTEKHHHHLVCTECGRTEEIDGGPVEKWASQVASSHGFELTGHDAEVYGLCPECREKKARAEKDGAGKDGAK